MQLLTIYNDNCRTLGDPFAALLMTLTAQVDPERSLTVAEAAAFLAISARALGDLARAGKFPFHRIGTRGRGRVLFKRTDLIDYRDRQVVLPRISRLHDHILN